MEEKYKAYTGTLVFRGVIFMFSFQNDILHLYPYENQKSEVVGWTLIPTANGVYVDAGPIPVTEKYLTGACGGLNGEIVFFPMLGSTLGINHRMGPDESIEISIRITAFIVFDGNRTNINQITFLCPELNYIYPVEKAVSLTTNPDNIGKGVYTVTTNDFGSTTTEQQMFIVDGKEVKICFGIARNLNRNAYLPPISLQTELVFEFDPTSDYSFLIRLCRIAKEFVGFLCYRNNVVFPKIKLLTPFQDGRYTRAATLCILNQDGPEEESIIRSGRCIKQDYISGCEGKILTDIAEGKIYLRHIPDSFRSGRNNNAARFVMITAAFEWEFSRLYPEGWEKSEKKIDVEREVAAEIQEHIGACTGRKKVLYQRLLWDIKLIRLETKIMRAGNDHSDIVGVFGEQLYHINGEIFNITELATRLANQRNNFAHGNLEKDFIGLSLLDLVFLKYLIYAMQLKYYGVPKTNIQKAINELFQLRLIIDG